MSQSFPEIKIETFQSGLITDPSATDLPLDAATTATNCDLTSIGKLKKSRGNKSFGLPTIPTGLTVEAFYEFHITNPAEKDITVIFGANGGRDRFYITPYWDDLTSAWVTNAWLELTEVVSTTIESVNPIDDKDFTVASATGLGATNDYHNKWYIMIFTSADVHRGTDYVLDYIASTRNLITKTGVSVTTVGDKVILMRFPVFKKVSTVTPQYQIDSLPAFTQHGEHLYIYTGSHGINDGGDLWLGFVGTASASQGYFDDDTLNFKGFHFDLANTFQIDDSWISTTADVNETQNPLPFTDADDRWIFKATCLLDGFQESMIFFDEATVFTYSVSLPDATTTKTVNISIAPLAIFPRYDPWLTPTTTYHSILSRRARKILFYVARGRAAAAGATKAVTPFFMWKELDIDSSSWTGSGPYTLALTLSGIEWEFAQKFPYEINTGHFIEKLGANGKFGEQAGGNFVVGPIYADQEYRDVLIITPLSGVLVGKNIMPNVLPLSQWLRFRDESIYEILYWTQFSDNIIVIFGKNTIAVAEIDGINSRISGKYENPGLISARGVKVFNSVAYYPGKDSIYAFNGAGEAQNIGNKIKSDWQAISLANRQACFSVFNERLKQYILVAGSTMYVYSVEQDAWATESLDKTWTYLTVGVDEELLGTDGTDIFQLDATSYTTARALTWKSRHFNSSRVQPRRFRASYKTSDTLTAKLYDLETSLTVPKETIYLLPASTETHVDIPVSFESKRSQIELTSSSSTNDDTEIDYLALAGPAKSPR